MDGGLRGGIPSGGARDASLQPNVNRGPLCVDRRVGGHCVPACTGTGPRRRRRCAGSERAARPRQPRAGDARNLYPASNVIFSAQSVDPETVKPDGDPSILRIRSAAATGDGSRWRTRASPGEAANLLSIPGRVCLNGKPAPSQNADWQKWVEELRAAGMASYKAGQAKSQDAVLEAADVMSVACSNCHEKYREVPGGVAARCQ